MGMGEAPILSSRILNSLEFKILTTSALSLSTTALGVWLGANMPTQNVYSELGTPASTVVGTCGKSSERWGVPTAKACSLPSFTKGSADTIGAKNQSMRPLMVSVSASGVPLNGTCTALIPALTRNFSALMCVAEPVPADA